MSIPTLLACSVCLAETAGRCGCGDALCRSCWHTVAAVKYNHVRGKEPADNIERKALVHIDHPLSSWDEEP